MIRRCWHWFFAEQRGGVVARVWWQLASFLQNTLELHHDTQGAAQLGKASRCANPSAGLSGFVCVATVEVAHVAFNLIRAQPCSGQHLAFMCLGGAQAPADTEHDPTAHKGLGHSGRYSYQPAPGRRQKRVNTWGAPPADYRHEPVDVLGCNARTPSSHHARAMPSTDQENRKRLSTAARSAPLTVLLG